MRCVVHIASPWRMGMQLQCELQDGHASRHQWTGFGPWDSQFNMGDAGPFVEWTGEHPKFTARERARRAS